MLAAMSSALRMLLWIVAILAPGGFLVLPLLIADALKRKLQPHRSTWRVTKA
jgi:hypothetical protein